MRTFVAVLVVAAGIRVSGREAAVLVMPVSRYADTEVSTNLPINRADISYVDLKFRFEGTLTNNLELAFGTDVNTNGVLDVEEIESRFGWRGGRFFIENVRTWELFSGEAADSTTSLSVDMHLEVGYDSQQVRSLDVSGVNAAAFAALVSAVPPAWLWRRKWNLMRATRRGLGPPSDWISYRTSHRGYSLIMR